MSKVVRGLTLLVPGLWGPAARAGADAGDALRLLVEDLDLASFEHLLSCADPFTANWPDDTLEGMLFHLFGVPSPAGVKADWPVAAVTRMIDGDATGGGWCMRADPVHLHADFREVRLFDANRFTLTSSEAKALAADVNAHFGPSFSVSPLHPERWYLTAPTAARIQTRSPSSVAAATLENHLPHGEDATQWRRILTEVQMLLHASPTNAAREARGELPINALWFWGGGTLPHLSSCRWRKVWSDDALALGLARIGGVSSSHLPDSVTYLLDEVGSNDPAGDGEHLVVIEDGMALARGGDIDAWRDWLTRLQTTWIAPLAGALQSGIFSQFTLLTDAAGGFRHRGRSRWWRRRSSFTRLSMSARA